MHAPPGADGDASCADVHHGPCDDITMTSSLSLMRETEAVRASPISTAMRSMQTVFTFCLMTSQ